MRAKPKGPAKDMRSEHFTAAELCCPHCGELPGPRVVQNTLNWLERVREWLGNLPIIVNSCYRCNFHNMNVGGVANSYHRKGWAADIVVVGLHADRVADRCEEAPPTLINAVGRYRGRTHIERGNRRRQHRFDKR